MKIVISGSSGFIGKYLQKHLQENGETIIPVDLSDGIDVCNWDQIKNLNGFDAIIHLANKSFVPDSYKHPLDFYKTNINSTLNMLELCMKNNAKFIYLSSYMYGHPEYLPIDEMHPVKALNPYAQSKIICEEICEGYSRDFNVPVIIFRPFNIYGVGQNEKFLIPEMIRMALNGKITIKDERPRRDFIHIKDVVNAIFKALKKDQGDCFEIFNIGSGESYSVKELGTMIISALNKDVDFVSLGEIRTNEVMDTVADIQKIKQYLHWAPEIDINTGLRGLLNFYQD